MNYHDKVVVAVDIYLNTGMSSGKAYEASVEILKDLLSVNPSEHSDPVRGTAAGAAAAILISKHSGSVDLTLRNLADAYLSTLLTDIQFTDAKT